LQLFFEILLGKLFLESCSWEHEQPVHGNLAREPVRCETFLPPGFGTLLDNLARLPIIQNLASESVI
jgi:hypothetical protein